MSRQTLHAWLARYEAEGLDGLVDRSHRPSSCPHQMDPDLEVAVLEARRKHPGWGPRRLVFELVKGGLSVSESGVYRALRRAGLIEPGRRRREQRDWRRWERARPNELWQLDVVGEVLLADGTSLKCPVPGLMEALIPRKDESHGSTEEVSGGASGAGDQDGCRSAT